MSDSWYYVDGSERVGPVSADEIYHLMDSGTLDQDSYVWTKGFDDWEKIKNVSELSPSSLSEESVENVEGVEDFSGEDLPGPIVHTAPNWDEIGDNERVISIKIGTDRGGEPQEYGPYSKAILKKLIDENRINEKTLIFLPGMDTWTFLADTPLFESLSGGLPPVISDEERRENVRKPFVARMFFHNNDNVFEGVCRDISVGGLQILVSGFPGVIGDSISMNVHPDNSDFCFVATGKIVRLLPGGQGFSIRFTTLSGEAKSAVESYIENYG